MRDPIYLEWADRFGLRWQVEAELDAEQKQGKDEDEKRLKDLRSQGYDV